MGYNCEAPRYPLGQKECVLEALALNDTTRAQEVLREEVGYIDKGLTTADFLEFLPGDTLLECMSLLRDVSDQSRTLKQGGRSIDSFEEETNRRFGEYLTALRQLVEDPQKHPKVNAFVSTKRKALGMCSNVDQIKELSEIMLHADSCGILNREDVIVVHYPGSFHPFPHKGHLEVARLVHSQVSRSDITPQPCRTVISTNAANPNRPALLPTFHERLENLRRGFFDEEYSSVLGIAGDFVDKRHRIAQLLLVARFDRDQRLRLVLGSDNFINTFHQATDGVDYYKLLLAPENQIFVSLRKGDDHESIMRTINQVEQAFKTEIIPLPPQHERITGTFIRSQPPQNRRDYAPNKYVRLDI